MTRRKSDREPGVSPELPTAPDDRAEALVSLRSSARRQMLLSVFVVSGFTGLIYESIWTHYLKLFLGHAAYAQAFVLGIFMGGMALGSWAVARYSTRIRNLLVGYVVIEGLIGILGIAFHSTFVAASDFSFTSVIPALSTSFAIHAYKWTLAALLILPQSVLLGMTFPLISGGLIRRWPDRPGATIATLYFTNSLGAAVGVLVSGFVLIGAVGLPGTVLTAGLLNVALALTVWFLVRQQPESIPKAHSSLPTSLAAGSMSRWIMIAALLTGMASFMYEIGWIRMLSMVLGSTTHSFEIMLSAFIFGLAFGGLYVRRHIEGAPDLTTYIGFVMVVTGMLAALTVPAYISTFDFMAWALRTFTRTESGYVAFNFISQSIAGLVMMPATFCAGMTLPLLTRALMQCGGGERAIGTIYAVNTLGAIVGVFATIGLLLPLIGVKGVILSGAAVHVGLGLTRLYAVRRARATRVVMASGAAIVVLGFVIVAVRLDPSRIASGVYRTGFATLPVDASVTYLRDGRTATISLVEQKGVVAIATNGKPDAAINMGSDDASRDEVTMVLLGAIPLSLRPHTERVANIGFGSGLTAHVLLGSEELKQLDTIEIEPLIVEAARKGFGKRISNVFDDPRSRVIYEDAKTFFATSREPYDLIVSEPSNPWVSGVATLFSDEFYSRISQYVRTDGYFVQWIQAYETDIGITTSIIKALAPHFGAYAMYRLDDSNILIIATRGPTLGTPDDAVFRWPQMRAELARIGVQSLADIRRRKIGDNGTIGPLFAGLPAPANSDYFPFVDLNAPRLRYLQRNDAELVGMTVMPIPFLEMLAGGDSATETAVPSAKGTIEMDGLVRRALAIRRAVADGKLAGLDGGSASYLLVLEANAARCADPSGQDVWKTAVRRVSDQTAAYLRPAELSGLWNWIDATPCYRALVGEHRSWADLLGAIARRDAPVMARLGAELLTSDVTRAPEERGYLTTVAALGLIRTGRSADAHVLLYREWGRLEHPGPYELPLLTLIALTDSAAASGSADKVGGF